MAKQFSKFELTKWYYQDLRRFYNRRRITAFILAFDFYLDLRKEN